MEKECFKPCLFLAPEREREREASEERRTGVFRSCGGTAAVSGRICSTYNECKSDVGLLVCLRGREEERR